MVAAFDGPMSRLSVLLERILHQLLKFVPAHIGSTQDAISSLKLIFPDLKAPKNTILVTTDVVTLYPSIPIEDGMSAVREMLQQHGEEIDMLGLTCDEIIRLIRFVLKNNYFRFEGTVYQQRQGVAMGNHLAQPFAIIFMGRLEQRMLETAE